MCLCRRRQILTLVLPLVQVRIFSLVMPYYVICGKPDCPGFAHAVHVAQYLNKHLPMFEYQKIEKAPNEWGPYVGNLNKRNRWFITESPLIWKEINMWGGKKYLIGGLSEFWEYVYCYYGLESTLPKVEILKLAEDNSRFFQEKETAAIMAKQKQEENQRVISILGVCQQTPILIFELLELKCLRKKQEIHIKVFDILGGRDNARIQIIQSSQFHNDFSETERLTVVQDIKSALENCDILIYMYDLSRKMDENDYEWLSRVFYRIQTFAENINEYGRRNLRVIFNCYGPSCFMASILLESCTKLRPSNIVVVTSDQGLSMLSIISEKTGILVSQMSAPPVWGFIGVNSYVDEKNIVFKSEMYRPYKRALTAPQGATLPLGTVKCELRLLSYLVANLDHDEIMGRIQERKEKAREYLGYRIGLPKVRALISLLQEWYAEVPSDNIISLGIYSDGSFELPTGIVFSQPVKLDDTGKWVPYSKFPLMNDNTREQIGKCAKQAKEICQNFIVPVNEYFVDYEDENWEKQDQWLPIMEHSDKSYDTL